jgi:hypothetical protein
MGNISEGPFGGPFFGLIELIRSTHAADSADGKMGLSNCARFCVSIQTMQTLRKR